MLSTSSVLSQCPTLTALLGGLMNTPAVMEGSLDTVWNARPLRSTYRTPVGMMPVLAPLDLAPDRHW